MTDADDKYGTVTTLLKISMVLHISLICYTVVHSILNFSEN